MRTKTKNGKKKLFAIYKNGFHKGNVGARNEYDAIRDYICDSLLADFLDDKEFLSQYSAVLAIEGIHFGGANNSIVFV